MTPDVLAGKLIQPLPWHVGRYDADFHAVYDSNDVVIFGHVTRDEASFIVRAVNAHADLLAALKGLADRYTELIDSGDCGFWDPRAEAPVQAALAAIAKAEGR